MAGLKKQVGSRVRLYRKQKGWTQGQLALKVKRDPKYIGALERGEKGASLETLGRLARALGIKPHQLLLPKREVDRPTSPELDKRLQSQIAALHQGEKKLLTYLIDLILRSPEH